MTFDQSQPSFQALRDIFAERSDSLVAWVGAGLSVPAELPSWSQLRLKLTDVLERSAAVLTDVSAQESARSMLKEAKSAASPWDAFMFLKKGLGVPEYTAQIREQLKGGDTARVPKLYKTLWEFGVCGMVNLNIDRLAQRAMNEVLKDMSCCDFVGNEIENYVHVLKQPHPWLACLHGQLDNAKSWVFTASEISWLKNTPAYDVFVKALFSTRRVVFVGISADDEAAGGHLSALTQLGIDCGDHFWITDRSDGSTISWARDAGVRLIHYRNSDGSHQELYELFGAIKAHVPHDDIPAPVVITRALPSVALPEPDDLIQRSSQDIREILNAEASRLLAQNTLTSVHDFETFADRYWEAIHRAWGVPRNPSNYEILGYRLTEKIADGGFGTVYRAVRIDDPNEAQLAVKILHERIREDHELLQSFRRGVRSMRILSDESVKGVVPYCDATEIPAMVVMEFVEGINLSEAVQRGVVKDWQTLLRISIDLARIIRTSHRLPQRVLHRDIRPSNVMLRNCYAPNADWQDVEVVVLDFDLSWHLDAFEVSISNRTVSGYLAPEQIDRTTGDSTRNAAVDSYGIGMTLYFLRTGVDPDVLQHRHRDWNQTLQGCAHNYSCAKWRSLPVRFCRLIEMATQHAQRARWDMTFILAELERLAEAESEPNSVRSAELLSEELAARAFDLNYKWDLAKSEASQRIGGIELTLTAEESRRRISFRFKWNRIGGESHQATHKLLPERQRRILDRLSKISHRPECHYDTGRLFGKAEIETETAASRLEEVAKTIAEVGHDLNL